MGVRREIKEIITCDFCGKEYEPTESYPRGSDGELAVFGLGLTIRTRDRICGVEHVYGENSDCMGYCSGYICSDCLREITTRIKYNKTHKAEGDSTKP